MNECNSIEVANTYSNLSDQTKLRLKEINKIKDYLNFKKSKKKNNEQKFSKYITAFGYFDKALLILSATS